MNDKKTFFGWWIVVGCFFITAVTVGLAINSFSIFYNPIVNDLEFTMGSFSLTSSVIVLAVMLGALLAGKAVKQVNIRLVMTISGLIYCIGFILFSKCETLTQFYICAALVGMGAAGTYLIPIPLLITNWFEEKRGLAMGIALTGSGLGGMIFNPLNNWLIINIGWHAAFLILGIIAMVAILPFSMFVVRLNPGELGLMPYGCAYCDRDAVLKDENGLLLSEAVRTSSFWLLGTTFLIIGILILGVQMHIPTYLENVGHTSTFVAYVLVFTNGLLILGKLVYGGIHDKYGTKTGVIYIFIVYILSLITLIACKATLAAVLFTILFGFSATIATVTIPLWTIEVLGKKDYATVYPIMNIFLTVGSALGAPITGFIFDAKGTYMPAWSIYIVLSVIGMMLALMAYSKRKPSIIPA